MNIVIKKMINFMQEHYNIFMYVSFFVIFFYPFNISLKDYVYKNDFILFILMVISLLIIFIESLSCCHSFLACVIFLVYDIFLAQQ